MYGLDRRKILILKHLIDRNDYLSSEALASVIGASSRTVREDIKLLDLFLHNFGAGITSRAGFGYAIECYDFDEYWTFVQVFREKYQDESLLPPVNSERITYILGALLRQDYIRSADLMDRMFISQTTLSADLSLVRSILLPYHLELGHRPGAGLFLQGEERHKRILLSDYLYADEDDSSDDTPTPDCRLDNREIREKLAEGCLRIGIHVGMNSFNEISDLVIASSIRGRTGHPIGLPRAILDEVRALEDYGILGELLAGIWPEASEEELAGLVLYFLTRRVYSLDEPFPRGVDGGYFAQISRIQARAEAWAGDGVLSDRQITAILPLVLKCTRLRVRYGYEYRNVPKAYAKQRSSVYDYAALIGRAVCQEWSISLSDGELAYLASELRSPLTQAIRTRLYPKQRVCIVSRWGKNGGLLYAQRLQDYYHSYLESVCLKEFYEVQPQGNPFDILLIDIPKVKFSVDIPVFQIKYGLSYREGKHLRSLFSQKKEWCSIFCARFSPELFFRGEEAGSPAEFIHRLGSRMGELLQLPELEKRFCEQDCFAGASRGNGVAICHSFSPICTETRIAVATLRRPLAWGESMVSLVFLVALGRDEQPLYSSVSSLAALLTDVELVGGLLRAKNFSALLDLIRQGFDRGE